MHDGMQYDLIQGYGHEPFKVGRLFNCIHQVAPTAQESATMALDVSIHL